MKSYRIVLAIILLLTFAGLSWAAEKQDFFAQGKAHYQARDWFKAIPELEEAVNKQTNAEAYFMLGRCYAETNQKALSDARYESAIALSLQNTGKLKRTVVYLDVGRIADFRRVIDEVVKEKPELQKQIAGDFYNDGLIRLKKNDLAQADAFFSLARSYDLSFNAKICDQFYKLSAISYEATFEYAVYTRNYCQDQKRLDELGERILAYAVQGKGNERQIRKNVAARFLPDERINQAVPPPHWSKVFERTYTGKGFGENDWVATAEFGKDIRLGARTTVIGKNFSAFDGKVWEDFTEIRIRINNSGTSGRLGIKAENNEKFTVIVEELVE